MKQLGRRKPVFIFDIGGVVIIWRNNDPIFKYIAEKYNVPFSKMQALMNRILPELEAGKITSRQFVKKSLSSFGKELRTSDDPDQLITIPFTQAKSRKGVIEIIQNLKKRGYEIDAFSNTNKVHIRLMKKRGWATPLFNRFFASCYLGLLKPDPKAYKLVLSAIHTRAKDVIFVDNTERNVLGAKNAGIRNSIRFHSIVDLKRKIRKAMNDYS
jgi:putative hydrolase of the HAD superfamily